MGIIRFRRLVLLLLFVYIVHLSSTSHRITAVVALAFKAAGVMSSQPTFEAMGQRPISNSPLVDVLNTDVAQLQQLLQQGRLTSVELADKYLAQIERHNLNGHAIRALISVAPRHLVLERAQQLDDERSSQGTRGPFHGIPTIVKVDSIPLP